MQTNTCVLSPIENNDFDGDIKEEVRGGNATPTKTHTCVLSPIENNDYNLLNVKPVRKERDTVIKYNAETVDEQTVLNELKKQ